MKINLLIGVLALICVSQSFADVNSYVKKEGEAIVKVADPEAKQAIRACTLSLSNDDAAANSAQIVEFLGFDGQKNTVAYYKIVSVAGLSHTANIRIYPGQKLEDSLNEISEIVQDLGATKLSKSECYNF